MQYTRDMLACPVLLCSEDSADMPALDSGSYLGQTYPPIPPGATLTRGVVPCGSALHSCFVSWCRPRCGDKRVPSFSMLLLTRFCPILQLLRWATLIETASRISSKPAKESRRFSATEMARS